MNTFWMKMCSLSVWKVKKKPKLPLSWFFQNKAFAVLCFLGGEGGGKKKCKEDQQLDNLIKSEQGIERMVAIYCSEIACAHWLESNTNIWTDWNCCLCNMRKLWESSLYIKLATVFILKKQTNKKLKDSFYLLYLL